MQENNDFIWKRFWFKRGEVHPNALSDDGFLFNPDSEYADYIVSNAVTLDSLSSVPCLILLGEPGIGKSYSLKSTRNFLEKSIKENGDQFIWLDLRSIESSSRLNEKLFKSDLFIMWTKGTHRLHLFLDSLDEGLLQLKSLAKLLQDELTGYPVERLSIRIACRTAEWPSSLEKCLLELWGENEVNVYQLAPLRKIDVANAAKCMRFNPDSFLREIINRNAQPLAIKPVTLKLLLNLYKKTGNFPVSQRELYSKGCEILCGEVNPDRIDAGQIGIFPSRYRFITAARIAALTVFANRYAISTRNDYGDVPDEDLKINEICGDAENVGTEVIKIEEKLLRETLSTGLFISIGPNRMGWAHQTFAEFLAAYYLEMHRLEHEQLMSMLTQSVERNECWVPQLSETISWLAINNEQLYKQLRETEPTILIKGNVILKKDNERITELVDFLLKLYNDNTLMRNTLGGNDYFKNLNHPGLLEQLRFYIRDNTKNDESRNLAIDIAEKCKLGGMVDELIKIVLDMDEPMIIRTNAAYAIPRIGERQNPNLKKLLPLAFGKLGDDPDDELKGNALNALWPVNISTKDMFDSLTEPQSESFYGAYNSFLSQIPSLIEKKDLYFAFEWIKNLEESCKESIPYSILIESILRDGIKYLDSQEIIDIYAQALLSSIDLEGREISFGNYNRNEEDNWFPDDLTRKKVLKAMVSYAKSDRSKILGILFGKLLIVKKEDFFWALDCLKFTQSSEEKEVWAEILLKIIEHNNLEHMNEIIKVSKIEPVLEKVFGLTPIDIDSPEANKKKTKYLDRRKLMKDREKREEEKEMQVDHVFLKVQRLLDESNCIKASDWGGIFGNLCKFNEFNNAFLRDGLMDATRLPVWDKLEEKERVRVIEAARIYIVEYDIEAKVKFETGISHLEISAISAFYLVFQESRDFFSNLLPGTWEKWLALLLDYPRFNGLDLFFDFLSRLAYNATPSVFVQVVSEILDRDINSGWNISITEYVQSFITTPLLRAFELKLEAANLIGKARDELLRFLLKNKSTIAKEYSENFLSKCSFEDQDEREKAKVIAGNFMIYSDNVGWQFVWAVMKKFPELCKEILLYLVEKDEFKNIVIRLEDAQLTELYILMETHFPRSEEPEFTYGAASSLVELKLWKDKLINLLVQRGTPEACKGIKKIIKAFPENEGMNIVLYEAQEKTRYHTWMPYKPKDILEVVKSRNYRFVQDGKQLLNIIIDSLKRLEKTLQGEDYCARFLWDRIASRKYRPKGENIFSDYVKKHLKEELVQKGIIVNREVQIRGGQKTDIHVDAIAKGGRDEIFERVSVIIEVKGCWHRELKHAMEMQLVGRYLKNNQCRHGLYLVGWFNCSQWDEQDSRNKSAPKMSLEEIGEELNHQAGKLSQGDLNIKAFVMNAQLIAK